MDDPIELMQGRDESLAQVLGLYDTPAYVRRGLQLTLAREWVFRRCETTREEWLRWVRMNLKLLRQGISEWGDIRTFVAAHEDCQLLADLEARLIKDTAAATARRATAWGLRGNLRALVASISRFNQRWVWFLENLDLSEVNALVAAYNRYYLLEKECAMRSPRLAAKGFEPARELTREEIERRFPRLPMPKLRAR